MPLADDGRKGLRPPLSRQHLIRHRRALAPLTLLAVHPPSIAPALRSPWQASSGQALPRHTEGPVYRCSLPGLAGLTGFRCAGPDLHRHPPRLSPTRTDLGRGFDPARADCGYRAPLPPHLARPHRDTSPARPAAVSSMSVGGEGGVWTP